MQKGIYDKIINIEIEKQLNKISNELKEIDVLNIHQSSSALSLYIAKVLNSVLEKIRIEDKTVDCQIEIANKIIKMLSEYYDVEEYLIPKNEVLKYIYENDSLIIKRNVERPKTSLTTSSIFTGNNEYSYFSEIQKEIMCSDKIDIIISFIMLSGINLIYNQLKTFTDNGGELRILTTVYMGNTEAKAIQRLNQLKNTKIKISYNCNATRLHTKSYIFHRNNGFTTAYIGSSNLSKAAMTDGMEWNMKVTNQDLPDVIHKMISTYDMYWNHNEFELYNDSDFDKLCDALNINKANVTINNPYEFIIRPYDYQQDVLNKIEFERTVKNNYKNLIICPTGVGKTAIAGFDYKRFCQNAKSTKLLFIAHRKELLEQGMACFRQILGDPNFGEIFLTNNTPKSLNHLFCSISLFNSRKMYEKLPKDYYDYIVIDEVHHSAADQYQELLNYFEPKVLLGLTATPDRLDGKDIYEYFNNKVSAEIYLSDAIEQGMLSPFLYFGLTDTIDLENVKWVNGQYDIKELNDLYVNKEHSAYQRALYVVKAVNEYINDIDNMKALGFCVSIEHAQYMEKIFNQNNIKAIALSSQSSDSIRNNAKQMLRDGKVKVIFVRDLYNEGVDIKEINTVMFLRPTESKTIFLQQFGRGLRKCDNKPYLTALDFIAQVNKKYSYKNKYAALIGKKDVLTQTKYGFPTLPSGCHIVFEEKAKEYVINNLTSSRSLKEKYINELLSFEYDYNRKLNLENFFSLTGYDIKELYGNNKLKNTFYSLKEEAFNGKVTNLDKEQLILFRLSFLNDLDFIKFTYNNIENISLLNYEDLSVLEKSYIRILFESIYKCSLKKIGKEDFVFAIEDYLSKHELLRSEIKHLMQYNYDRYNIIGKKDTVPFDSTLKVHCTYNRRQIFAALDKIVDSDSSEGVKTFNDLNCDILFVTIDKNHSHYTDKTSYNDYPINKNHFKWETQNKTSENTSVGQRYISTKTDNSKSLMLFVREKKDDQFGSCPYVYLGRCRYVSHIGNKPMEITLKLDYDIPELFSKYIKGDNYS